MTTGTIQGFYFLKRIYLFLLQEEISRYIISRWWRDYDDSCRTNQFVPSSLCFLSLSCRTAKHVLDSSSFRGLRTDFRYLLPRSSLCLLPFSQPSALAILDLLSRWWSGCINAASCELWKRRQIKIETVIEVRKPISREGENFSGKAISSVIYF